MSTLERFRTGGVSQRRAATIEYLIGRLIVILVLLWLASWLLSWHFVRVLGVFLIVLAGQFANDVSVKR